MGGWSNGKTPALQAGDRGSTPRPVHWKEVMTLEPDGQATGCNPGSVGSTPTGVSRGSRWAAPHGGRASFLDVRIVNELL